MSYRIVTALVILRKCTSNPSHPCPLNHPSNPSQPSDPSHPSHLSHPYSFLVIPSHPKSSLLILSHPSHP